MSELVIASLKLASFAVMVYVAFALTGIGIRAKDDYYSHRSPISGLTAAVALGFLLLTISAEWSS